MGKSYLIPKVLFIDNNSFGEWKVKERGKANNDNLEKAVFEIVDSFNKPGGVNHHIVKAENRLFMPQNAKIVNQYNGQILAVWKAGMFQVF